MNVYVAILIMTSLFYQQIINATNTSDLWDPFGEVSKTTSNLQPIYITAPTTNTQTATIQKQFELFLDRFIKGEMLPGDHIYLPEEIKDFTELEESMPNLPEKLAEDLRYGIWALESLYYKANNQLTNYYAHWEKAALANDPLGLYLLGLWDLKKYDSKKALQYFQDAAQKRYHPAMYRLGIHYKNQAQGNETNLKIACEWFKRAADLGNVRAMTRMAECYNKGQGINADQAKGRALYQLAANLGDIESQLELGKQYKTSRFGVSAEIPNAIKYLRMASERRSKAASIEFCNLFDLGLTEDQRNEVRSIIWWEAERGNEKVLAALVYIFEDELRKDIKQGGTPALGEIDWDALYDYLRSINKTKVLLIKGLNKFTAALNKLATWLESNQLDAKKTSAAFWTMVAAHEWGEARPKDDKPLIVARLRLSRYFSQGIGVTKNEKMAVHWLNSAAKGGSEEAIFELAKRYEAGNGVKKDEKKAKDFYKTASKKGHQEAEKAFTRMSQNLFRRNCEKAGEGDKHAKFSLGHFYRTDEENRNYALSLEYFLQSGEDFVFDKFFTINWDQICIGNALNPPENDPEILATDPPHIVAFCSKAKNTLDSIKCSDEATLLLAGIAFKGRYIQDLPSGMNRKSFVIQHDYKNRIYTSFGAKNAEISQTLLALLKEGKKIKAVAVCDYWLNLLKHYLVDGAIDRTKKFAQRCGGEDEAADEAEVESEKLFRWPKKLKD